MAKEVEPVESLVPDIDADPDARAAALTGTELEALEELVPGPAEQALLDYAKGAHLGLPELVDLVTEVGGLANMLEHQAATIRHLQARLAKNVAAVRKAAAQREGLPE